MNYPVTPIPRPLEEILKPFFTQEKMGIRYLDESGFKSEGLQKISLRFSSLSRSEQLDTLFMLRECARSACILPVKTPAELKIAPTFLINETSTALLALLIDRCIRQNLALPVFKLEEGTELKNLLSLYTQVLATEYRGPLFIAAQIEIHADYQRVGLLNKAAPEALSLEELNLDSAVNSLIDCQWFRVRILPLAEPWMHQGFTF